MPKFIFNRVFLCALLTSVSLAVTARTYVGSETDGAARPAIDALGNVAFSGDNFDYSKSNFDRFSYSYINESGERVTVPLTTPATTPAAMKALLREVYTNRDIPGRKWVDRDGGRNIYVDYTVAPGSKAIDIYGLTPGEDYTPHVEGETCLLVEGKDDNDKPASDQYGFDRLKSITLVTERYTIGDNSTVGGLNSPGYVFNIAKPLHKFYFITKGKARATDFAPLCSLYEEYSPNEEAHGLDQVKTDVYYSLSQGNAYYVRHDCSTVVYNTGHFMVMGSLDDAAPAYISLSVFIPYYRSYDDTSDPTLEVKPGVLGSSNERFTWYDPKHRPFFYYYHINLNAKSQVNEGIVDSLGRPAVADVTLNWTTNFRTKLFNTPADGEFMAYKMVNGAIDRSHPIRFTSTPQGERRLTHIIGSDGQPVAIPNPYLQSTTIDGDRVLSNYDDEPVAATYQEPIEAQGRYVTYMVAGRPDGFLGDPTESNTVRVYIPGHNELRDPSFELGLLGQGSSEFIPSELTNAYQNTIQISNRDGLLAMTGREVAPGAIFTIYRDEIIGDVKSTTPIATIEVLREALPTEDDDIAWFGTDESGNPTVNIYKYMTGRLTYLSTGEVDEFVTWRASASRPGTRIDPAYRGSYTLGAIEWHSSVNPDGEPNSSMGIPDGSNIMAVIIDNFTASTSENDHPDRYQYHMDYRCGDINRASNVEHIDIYKAQVKVVPSTLTLDEVIAQEQNYDFSDTETTVELTVSQNPAIQYYRVRLRNSINDGDPGVVALVQNSAGHYSVSVPDDEGIFNPVGSVVDGSGQAFTTLTIPLEGLRSDYALRIADGESLVADIITEKQGSITPRGSAGSISRLTYNTYGTPETRDIPAPSLFIDEVKFGPFTPTQASYRTRRSAHINARVDYHDAIPQGYEALGVSHFAAWRDGLNPAEKPMFHNVLSYSHYGMRGSGFEGQTESFKRNDDGIFKAVEYYTADNSNVLLADGMADEATRIPYTLRAYVAIQPKGAKAGSPISYIMAENSILAMYNSNNILTGVEDVVGPGNTSLEIVGSDPLTIRGRGPITIFNASGAKVAEINDGATERVVGGLSSGVHIATNGSSTIKFIN